MAVTQSAFREIPGFKGDNLSSFCTHILIEDLLGFCGGLRLYTLHLNSGIPLGGGTSVSKSQSSNFIITLDECNHPSFQTCLSIYLFVYLLVYLLVFNKFIKLTEL